MGGSGASNVIQYVQINTLGNAADFGDLQTARFTDGTGFSNGIEAFCCGGYPATITDYEVVKIASLGNAVSGGSIRHGGYWPGAGCSNSTRGIWAGGANTAPANYTQEISFITMSSKGNAQPFGDLSKTSACSGGAGGNATRGVICWGRDGISPYPDLNILEFITFSSSGNSQDFGDLRGGENEAHSRHISPVSDSHGGLGGF